MRSKLIFVILLFLQLYSGVLAQNEEASPYDNITADNVNNLTEIAVATCEGDTHHASASFYGDTFAYACFNRENGVDQNPVIRAISLETGAEHWQLETSRFVRDFELLDHDLALLNLQSRADIYRIGNSEALFSQDFVAHANLVLSPDRQLMALITGDFDSGTVQIYQLPDLTLIEQAFTVEDSQNARIALSAQGLLAVAETNNRIRIYDIDSGTVLMEVYGTSHRPELQSEAMNSFPVEENHYFGDIIFSPSGATLLIEECTFISMGCWEVGLTQFDIETGDILNSLILPYSNYNFIGFTDDNHLLASDYCNEVSGIFGLETFSHVPVPHHIDAQCFQGWVTLSDDNRLIALYDYSEAESSYTIYGIPR